MMFALGWDSGVSEWDPDLAAVKAAIQFAVDTGRSKDEDLNARDG